MKYRVLASLLVLAVLAVCAALFQHDTPSAPAPTDSPPGKKFNF